MEIPCPTRNQQLEPSASAPSRTSAAKAGWSTVCQALALRRGSWGTFRPSIRGCFPTDEAIRSAPRSCAPTGLETLFSSLVLSSGPAAPPGDVAKGTRRIGCCVGPRALQHNIGFFCRVTQLLHSLASSSLLLLPLLLVLPPSSLRPRTARSRVVVVVLRWWRRTLEIRRSLKKRELETA